MMLYEREGHMVIRRIEEKLGIHGSPTCELQFNMAPCQLIGKRRYGLIKYMMSLLNGARLATTAQALGIAQAAYDEAVKYANEREQFGKKIVHFPAVYQMLKNMEMELETCRVLLYRTAMAVDYEDMYNRRAQAGENVKAELKEAVQLADFLTPLSKFTITEMANKIAYDSLQIHGGCGYMKDFPIQRLYRDARITNIYEGTTQLQVVAAIGGITSGLLTHEMGKIHSMDITALATQRDFIHADAIRINALVKNSTEPGIQRVLGLCGQLSCRNGFPSLPADRLILPFAEKYPEKREIFDFFLLDSRARLLYLADLIRNLQSHFGTNIMGVKDNFL